jgi:RNA polymerase sigma-70 factor (ECF subfamily)
VQRDLVEAARNGDHEAFEALAAAATDRLYAFAQLVLRDAHQAEDAVQDALVRAWQGLPLLRDSERWDPWLHRLIVNACADQGRHRIRHSAEVRMVRFEPVSVDQESVVDDHDQLDRGFRRLKPQQRAAVVLHFISASRSQKLPTRSGSRSARPNPGSITPSRPCGLRSKRTSVRPSQPPVESHDDCGSTH